MPTTDQTQLDAVNGRSVRAPRVNIDPTLPLERQPQFFTISDAAAYLRRSPRTLRSWESKGLLRCVRPAGGDPLVPKSEIQRLLTEGDRGAS